MIYGADTVKKVCMFAIVNFVAIDMFYVLFFEELIIELSQCWLLFL